jgi:hypothetical protein
MDRLLTIVNLLSIGLFILVLLNVRRERIRVEYSVSWLAAALVVFALTVSRRPTTWLERALGVGIGEGPTVLVIMILAAFLVVFYRFTRIISRLKDNNVALAQRVAVLEYLISSLHGKEAEEQTSTAGDGHS